MGKDVIQIKADEDGCIYIYDVATDSWQKICDVNKRELPDSIREKVVRLQRATR